MLVLSRQRDETIMIGDEVEVTVVDIRGDKVRLGITAPKEVTVHRKEVYEAIKRENRAAAQVRPEDLGSAGGSGRPSGPKLVGNGQPGESVKQTLRPTIRATLPESPKPQRPDRSPQRRPQQQADERNGGPAPEQSSPPASGGEPSKGPQGSSGSGPGGE